MTYDTSLSTSVEFYALELTEDYEIWKIFAMLYEHKISFIINKTSIHKMIFSLQSLFHIYYLNKIINKIS